MYFPQAIIGHTLKIHYMQNNEHQEFFVTSDTNNISIGISTLIEAQEKAELLKSMLAAANVPYIDAENRGSYAYDINPRMDKNRNIMGLIPRNKLA